MSEIPFNVTEASRDFADCVNRVRYQNASFTLHKNGQPVARLVPEPQKARTGRDLAAALSKVESTGEDSRAWREDLRKAREMLLPVEDKSK
jgi:antitoxin (DNA-binding transcriptional repressor) of toxin-antitoxin stability system